ncbi:hypothetical protein IHE44_0012752 [Lamprotornis superbus]|uniref:SMYD5 protein n=1 Tax=Lamprotornis superbus TaxID=245042 RepID=A0A835TN22_9PASS|nr:hypothetical protein IHE44_0012752 [Lamprotornis superbus]
MAAAAGPHAGAAAEARFISSAKGKGLFATKNIRRGETVFVERPVVSSQFLWNALYNYRACDHCLRALETAEENAQRLLGRSSLVLPHPEQCSIRKDLHQQCPRCQVTYCSAECRQAALEQYHQVLCLGPSRDDPTHPLNKLQEAWSCLCLPPAFHSHDLLISSPFESHRNMHYPPETSSIMLMARMVATIKQVQQAKDKEWWIKAFSQFCSKTANEEEEIVHKLLGDKFKGQLELLRLLFTEALYDEYLSRWFTPEGFRSLFALVGTNGQGIGTSCIPNAETSFPENNFLLHLTALEDIEAGEVRQQGLGGPEEICISYLDCCQRERSRHSRNKILRENYLFTCSCPKCLAQADDADVTSDEEEEGEGETDDAELEDEMTDV